MGSELNSLAQHMMILTFVFIISILILFFADDVRVKGHELIRETEQILQTAR